MMSKNLYKEFSDKLKKHTDQELIERFNHETQCKGWVSARGIFLIALQDEMTARGIDLSAVTNYSGGLTLKRKVTLVDNKLIPLL